MTGAFRDTTAKQRVYGKNDVTVCSFFEGLSANFTFVVRQDTHVYDSKVKQMEKLQKKTFLNSSEK